MTAESKIIASDGNDDDRFGKAVSISSDWIAIGANRDDDNGINSGSVYIYRYDEFNGEVANKIYERGFIVPTHPFLNVEDIDFISEVCNGVW